MPNTCTATTVSAGWSFRAPRPAPDPRGAVGLLRDTISGSSRPVTVIALGPLTNLAVLHAADPDVFARIERIVLMGGGVRNPLGNVTPAAEFNIWFDPEAAARVFSAGVPITMVGLDVTAVATLEPGDWAPLRGGGPIARAALHMVDYYGDFYLGANGTPATAQHDSLAVAAVCRPDLLDYESLLVDIECGGALHPRHDRGALPHHRVGRGASPERLGRARRRRDRLHRPARLPHRRPRFGCIPAAE